MKILDDNALNLHMMDVMKYTICWIQFEYVYDVEHDRWFVDN